MLGVLGVCNRDRVADVEDVHIEMKQDVERCRRVLPKPRFSLCRIFRHGLRDGRRHGAWRRSFSAGMSTSGLLLLLGALLFPSAAACSIDYRFRDADASLPSGAEEIHWSSYRPGIDVSQLKLEEPPQRLYFVRIDLSRPGVSLTTTPPNGPALLETNGTKTSTFLAESGAVLAVNASRFRPVEQREYAPKDIAGLAVHRGIRYSEDEPNQAFIATREDGRAVIARDQDAKSVTSHKLQTAVAGSPIVLQGGRLPPFGPTRHPRTAVGVTEDGRFLYILVAEGRMASRAIGLTLSEVGAWLKRLGASDGLNLDGGGSTTLVVRAPDGRAVRVNRTVDNPITGSERVVANHLGVRVEAP